ncbi:hypothetical protein ID866_6520 [Astraeus odoratus]|nr:hypothetical protein ID866_6520 [Astraeus odoratus]
MLRRSICRARLGWVSLPQYRAFSSSTVTPRNRAIIYGNNGRPSSVLSALTFPDLPPPPPHTVNIRFLLSPINPADISVIEGVYPTKPSPAHFPLHSSTTPVYVGGNEGLAEVVRVGDGVTELKNGDRVVMTRPHSGTWISAKNVNVQDVLQVPSDVGEAQAATMTLGEGDWVVQNGANSAVGQAVIQIAAARGWKTLNLVRDREDVERLKEYLRGLGATQVSTYDELGTKDFKDRLREWTGGRSIKLGLNCVSGRTTTLMARLLGQDGHLVSYGAMSKEPLSLPTSLLIFKNLTCHGFWQSCWYDRKSLQERKRLMDTLFRLARDGKLRSPECETLVVEGTDTDQQAQDKISEVMERLAGGKHGKKVLLKMEETP